MSRSAALPGRCSAAMAWRHGPGLQCGARLRVRSDKQAGDGGQTAPLPRATIDKVSTQALRFIKVKLISCRSSNQQSRQHIGENTRSDGALYSRDGGAKSGRVRQTWAQVERARREHSMMSSWGKSSRVRTDERSGPSEGCRRSTRKEWASAARSSQANAVLASLPARTTDC